MDKPLAYLDQNILGLLIAERVVLDTRLQWVYSPEHFAEVGRSRDPGPYLDALLSIEAKLLRLELVDWQPTGEALLILEGTPQEHYANYLHAANGAPFDQRVFDPIHAWAAGGATLEDLRSVPDQVAAQLKALHASHPGEVPDSVAEEARVALSMLVERMAQHDNDINEMRGLLGGGKGGFGSVTGKDQLLQVWEMVRASCGGLTSTQFFGFDPLYASSAPFSLSQGIAACCVRLDALGFHAEKKVRRVEKIPNVRSDAVHIGMGAYCRVLLSADARLVARARAIYEYTGIETLVVECPTPDVGVAVVRVDFPEGSARRL